MCTVSFIPDGNNFFITSNRDEKVTRRRAVPPSTVCVNGTNILCPADGDAGGSWIAVKENGDAAVLLNGAFTRHEPAPPYRESRGIVFSRLIASAQPVEQLRAEDLCGIAPFTLVLLTGTKLFEFRWDGVEKHLAELNASTAQIWSSVTLYDAAAKAQREQWFRKFTDGAATMDTKKITRFHRFAGQEDQRNGLVINRENGMRTVSITSIHIKPGKAGMTYSDLVEGLEVSSAIAIKKDLTKKERLFNQVSYRLRRTAIVFFSWEYWPFHFVYGPLYVYWLWLSLRARSFFFFSTANPGIENAGFTLERKSRIYALLPGTSYPSTLFVPMNETPDALLKKRTQYFSTYPLIAKPDIGERGTGVKLLHSDDDLMEYRNNNRIDFLLQEFIDYPCEAGIFYYRIPGESKGRISGIVGKELLGVTGDGTSTIEMLIKKENRFFLQWPVMKKQYGAMLQTILPAGESKQLVPYGNHCRGAKFTDLSDKATLKLQNTIDELCSQIPGFYYGRLDIKYRSWEELCDGKFFSIIELNGAGSEPTHIYDPKHSLFFAWKEIVRHWNILYRIGMRNQKKAGVRFMKTSEGLRMLKEHARHRRLLEIHE
ncbi:NRDE family protein [Sediminibacterium roseum]|uniref:NRDE family protein n=1 Tax=Sediminibacterium roseum TaxID=1978412 RepID=A0ABW9ZWB5_9BACT|nr:NRDE family protein [Sediminibacterium roseum]NCI50820.1 NRDE family protein [Sediminibacterium roseum]